MKAILQTGLSDIKKDFVVIPFFNFHFHGDLFSCYGWDGGRSRGGWECSWLEKVSIISCIYIGLCRHSQIVVAIHTALATRDRINCVALTTSKAFFFACFKLSFYYSSRVVFVDHAWYTFTWFHRPASRRPLYQRVCSIKSCIEHDLQPDYQWINCCFKHEPVQLNQVKQWVSIAQHTH